MPLTMQEARDEMLTLVKTCADANDVGSVWEGTAGDKPPDGPKVSWIRAGVRHFTRQQSTLSGSVGLRRYTSNGLLVVALFTPVESGIAEADRLASLFRNAVEGVSTSGAVWFRNARTNEMGLDGSWWRTDVLADFEYDEVR
jgi:hypothetical protein